jgi:hypothetical protein
VAKKLKIAVGKLESELKKEGISVKEHMEMAERKLRGVM